MSRAEVGPMLGGVAVGHRRVQLSEVGRIRCDRIRISSMWWGR